MRNDAQTKHDIVVLVSEVSKEDVRLLSRVADRIVHVSSLEMRQGKSSISKQPTKFYFWRFPYEQVGYIDSDHLLQRPEQIDSAFDACGESEFCAVQDPLMGENYFNAGFFILRPSEEVFLKLVEASDTFKGAPFAEQDMLNELFFPKPGSGSYADSTWKKLDSKFNQQHVHLFDNETLTAVAIHSKYWKLCKEGEIDPESHPWEKVVQQNRNEFELSFS